jgi:hypothetical protein
MQSKWRRVAWPLLAGLLIVGLIGTPVAAQFMPKETAPWLIARKLTVTTTSALTGNVTTGADLTVGDDATVTGDLVLAPATAVTVTNGMTLSPAAAYQPLTAAGAVGFGAITIGSAGSVLTLVNTANQTITITDTGTLKLSGNLALGQYDSVTLVSDGTNWIQLATSNN